jgi:hypothetical protein
VLDVGGIDRCYRGDGITGERGRKEDKYSQESDRVISGTTLDRHVQLESNYRLCKMI